jgi:TolB protein
MPSPDGLHFAFATGAYPHSFIDGVKADGSGLISLTGDLSYNFRPAWSPDGSEIAFLSNREDGFKLYVMKADGSDTRVVSQQLSDSVEPFVSYPAWSPDGQQLLIPGEFTAPGSRDRLSGFYRVAAQAAQPPQQVGVDALIAQFPAWSPDGSQIVFSSSATGAPDIYTIRPDGSQVQQLTNDLVNHEIQPAWSPDGRYIAFLSKTAEGQPELGMMTPDGQNRVSLAQNVSGFTGPVWSSDSNFVAFVSNQTGTFQIAVVDINSRELVTLKTPPVLENCLTWGP